MDDTSSEINSSSISQRTYDMKKNIAMLLKELKMSTEDRNQASVYSKVEDLLSKETDIVRMSSYIGLECDSDEEEIEEDESDIECFSDDESTRSIVDYDIEQMFEIVKKRDFSKWSISTIHHHYDKIHLDDAGEKQLSRMRGHIKRGAMKNRDEYERLRNDIWDEVYSLSKEGVSLHDTDLQYIAMTKALERNLQEFKASNGWVYYFKKQHRMVECYSDKHPVMKLPDDEMKLKNSIKRFQSEQIPIIMSYVPDKVWNVDQMGLHFEIPPGRNIIVRGTKKDIRPVQHIVSTIHNFTLHIQMKASGKLAPKLPVNLYKPVQSAKRARKEIKSYPNLDISFSEYGRKGSDIARQWMDEVFLNAIENDNVLIIDSWSGYEHMMEIPKMSEKNLKIIQLPFGSSSVLQPLDIYFTRCFKDLIRRVFTKIRWQQREYALEDRENVLEILDLLWFQCKAPKFATFLKYSWFRAGYTQNHSGDFITPVEYCLEFSGHMKCETDSCPHLSFIRCAHCEKYYCFHDALDHRHSIEL